MFCEKLKIFQGQINDVGTFLPNILNQQNQRSFKATDLLPTELKSLALPTKSKLNPCNPRQNTQES